MPLDGDGFGFDEGGIEGGDTPSSPRGRKTSISRALLAAVASTRDDGGDVGATFSFGGDEVTPWPTNFPDWVGLEFKHVSGDLGEGLEIYRQEYSKFEMHPDEENFPNVARARSYATLVEAAKGAPPWKVNRKGKKAAFIVTFNVDRKRKTMKVVGMEWLKYESDEGARNFAFYNTRRSVDAGDWSWYSSIADEQAVLNADNTILRKVDYKDDSVIATGDWSKAVVFYLARPPADSGAKIGADIAPAPPDGIPARLAELQRYFTAPDAAFRTPTALAGYDVDIHVDVEAVTEIQTLTEQFGAKLSLTQTWPVTKLDIVKYVAHPNPDEWVPMWCPPGLSV
eukprot:gene16116-13838_t